jgi:hypothetical protein
MKAKFEKCKNLVFCENAVKLKASYSEESKSQVKLLADELSK